MDEHVPIIVGVILGIVVLIVFFNIGSSVSAIRKDSRIRTRLTILSSGYLIGKTGFIMYQEKIRLLGEEWKCVSAEKLKFGAKVRVTSLSSVDWDTLTVEAIEP